LLNSKAIVLPEMVAVVTLLVMVSVVRKDHASHYKMVAAVGWTETTLL